jgi:O-antigen/teichoic acid export membrane protein
VLGYSPVLTGYLVLAFVALALFNLGVTFAAFLEAVGAMYLSALAGLVQKGTVIAVGIALILSDASLAAVMGAHVLAGGIYLAVAWRWARRRFGSFRMTYSSKLARELFVAAMPFLATAALWQVYSKVDVVMLRLMHGDMATGLYASAYKLVSAPVFVAALVGVAVFPTLSRAATTDLPEMKRVFRDTLRALAVIGLAGGVLLATAGDGLQVALFGAEFVESGVLVRWMAPLFVLEFLTVPVWRVLLAMDRERTLLVLRVFSVGLNVALNVVLIPVYGAMGAVASSLISEGLLALAQFILCARLVPGLVRAGRGWALAAIGAVAFGAGLFARTLMPWPLVALLVGVILAFLAAIFGLVSPSEIRHLLRQARLSTGQE